MYIEINNRLVYLIYEVKSVHDSLVQSHSVKDSCPYRGYCSAPLQEYSTESLVCNRVETCPARMKNLHRNSYQGLVMLPEQQSVAHKLVMQTAM